MSEGQDTHPGGRDSPRRGLAGEGRFLRVRAEVRRRVDGGEAIARIEEELIGPSTLSEEAKSALSSYGWTCREETRRRTEGRETQLGGPGGPQPDDRGNEPPVKRPDEPRTEDEVRADAIQRLDAALNEHARATERTQNADGSRGDLHAEVEAAAAKEQVAARRAWLDYVQRGH